MEKKKKFWLASPGFEPETFSVLDWRDNQLHHETFVVELSTSTYNYFLLWRPLGWVDKPVSCQIEILQQENEQVWYCIKKTWEFHLH